jgi:predicted phosphodiesterase
MYRGSHGTRSRERVSDTFYNQPYDLPVPSEYDSSDFIIPEKNVLLLADTQIPFHDNRAISATLDWAVKKKVDAILLNGDIIDLYQMSNYVRDPRERDVDEEIEDTKDFIETLRETFKGAKIYYKFGNHEDRCDRFMFSKAPELAKIKTNKLEHWLDLKKYGIPAIKDKRTVKIGHLNVLHGHEFRGGLVSPVNPARTLFLRAKEHSICGDRHITSEHSGRTVGGKLITCWSLGCLCQLKARYAPINEWNHGFAYVSNDGDIFRLMNMRIENGIVY